MSIKEKWERKLKYIFIWIILILFFEVIWVWAWFYLYKKWILNDSWNDSVWLLKLNYKNIKKVENDNFNNELNKNIKLLEIKNNNFKNKININFNEKTNNLNMKFSDNWIKINKDLILLSTLYKIFENKKYLIQALKLYMLKYNIKNIKDVKYELFTNYLRQKLFYTDTFKYYFNNIQKINKLINNSYFFFNNFINKIKNNEIRDNLKSYEYFLNNEKILTNNINSFITNYLKYNLNNTCYYKFCSYTWSIEINKNISFNKVYTYVKSAILRDEKVYKKIIFYWKQYWISPKVALSVIMIENIRQNVTYKWMFKRMWLKYKTPIVFVMTKFSYWLFWIKLNTLDRIINWKYLTKNNKYIIYILKNFYDKNKNYKPNHKSTFIWSNCYYKDYKKICLYKRKDNIDKKLIDYIVKNRNVQIILFYELLNQQIKIRKIKENINIRNNYWVLATLWNIWWFKKLNKNPDTWGSILNFYWTNIYFWDLANIIANSLELENMLIYMNNEK